MQGWNTVPFLDHTLTQFTKTMNTAFLTTPILWNSVSHCQYRTSQTPWHATRQPKTRMCNRWVGFCRIRALTLTVKISLAALHTQVGTANSRFFFFGKKKIEQVCSIVNPQVNNWMLQAINKASFMQALLLHRKFKGKTYYLPYTT